MAICRTCATGRQMHRCVQPWRVRRRGKPAGRPSSAPSPAGRSWKIAWSRPASRAARRARRRSRSRSATGSTRSWCSAWRARLKPRSCTTTSITPSAICAPRASCACSGSAARSRWSWSRERRTCASPIGSPATDWRARSTASTARAKLSALRRWRPHRRQSSRCACACSPRARRCSGMRTFPATSR